MQTGRISESELVLNPDGSVYHLHLKGENIAPNVILVGDPGRVQQVTGFFDSVDFQVSNREFHTVTGLYQGKPVTVVSTGIGTDNIDIVLNELDAAVNIDLADRVPKSRKTSLNLIRIGTSGALHEDIPVDSFVMSRFGLGLDGLIYYYDYKYSEKELFMSNILNKHLKWNDHLARPYVVESSPGLAQKIGFDMFSGITATATGFYGPQGRHLLLPLADLDIQAAFRSFAHNDLRIINFEMETSAIYGLGKMLGHNCCTCCAVIANRASKTYSKDYKPVVDNLIGLVLDRL